MVCIVEKHSIYRLIDNAFLGQRPTRFQNARRCQYMPLLENGLLK